MRNVGFEIRAFAPGDRDAVIGLMLELQRYELQFEPALATADRVFGEWYVDGVLDELRENDGVLLVAVKDGAPCGFIAAFDELDAEARSRHFYIAELSVTEPMRGAGIGQQLIAAVEEIARGRECKAVVIGVLAASNRTRALYKRLGYRDHRIKLRKPL